MIVLPKVKYAVAGSLVVLLMVWPHVDRARAQQPAPAASTDSASIAATITQLTEKFNAAVASNNTAVLDSMTASDAWVIRPNGERHNKTDWLASFAAKFHVTKMNVKPIVVHVHGDDVAVVAGTHIATGTLHTGGPITDSAVATIWVKRNGQWQVVLRSITNKTAGAK
jgi:ketosteroid isomerase-like protein